MKIQNVVIGKDLASGKDNLATLQDIFFALEARALPTTTPFCLLITLRAENGDCGQNIPYSVRIFTPDENYYIMLGSGTVSIKEEVTLLYLKGQLTFIQHGKHIIEITIGSEVKYKEAIFDVKVTLDSSIPASSSSLSSSSSSTTNQS